MASSDETLLRSYIQHWSDSLHKGDAEGLAHDYADDVSTAGLPPPLWAHDRATYIANMKNWLSGIEGPLTNHIDDLHVAVDATVAFAYGISHTTGKFKSGEALDMRVALRLAFEKLTAHGRWCLTTSPCRSI